MTQSQSQSPTNGNAIPTQTIADWSQNGLGNGFLPSKLVLGNTGTTAMTITSATTTAIKYKIGGYEYIESGSATTNVISVSGGTASTQMYLWGTSAASAPTVCTYSFSTSATAPTGGATFPPYVNLVGATLYQGSTAYPIAFPYGVNVHHANYGNTNPDVTTSGAITGMWSWMNSLNFTDNNKFAIMIKPQFGSDTTNDVVLIWNGFIDPTTGKAFAYSTAKNIWVQGVDHNSLDEWYIGTLTNAAATAATKAIRVSATNITMNTGVVTMGNGTSNWINYGAIGFGSPTWTTYSAGVKLILYDNIGSASTGYTIGIGGGFFITNGDASATFQLINSDKSSCISFGGPGVTLAASYGGSLFVQTNPGSSVSTRTFFGDGSGWTYCLSSRTGSATTDNFKLSDSAGLTLSSLAGIGVRTVSITAAGLLEPTPSDKRLKTNIVPLTDTLDVMSLITGKSAISAVNYRWKDNSRGTEVELGFIAQDWLHVRGVTFERQDGMYGMNYDRITAILWEQNRAQQEYIESLESRLSALEAKLK